MNRNNVSVGVLLIAVAVILLLGKIGVFGFLGSLLWPLLVLAPGVVLHMLYFNRVLPPGVLVPGGILVTYSLMFLFCNVFGWGAMSYIWPGFIFGVAVGLYELYFFERRDRGALTASVILTAVSALLFGMAVLAKLGVYFIVIVLVIAGLLLIWRRPRAW
ncbi:hypothetical protein SD70_04955 [Gordoniibacillus kamchatkensis]|uniref:DUF5668 domain-containing protein n=1 Tax=Gordoniibacillus kamchatkensis TaxID=1590651 RepID=A0ABR5ALB6_9BACL|nr:hypothetical protein [Paenibacillus sp. VKM B-2647]KIL41722.1 hypothetical protein SD70_04955 [Paenibacillus sp. VKM B-2647]